MVLANLCAKKVKFELETKKAPEWAAEINAIQTEEEWKSVLTRLVRSLLGEYLALVDARGKTTNGCLSSAKQLNEKWNAIARKIKRADGEGIAKDGFLKYIDANTSGMFQMHLATQKINTQMKRTKTHH